MSGNLVKNMTVEIFDHKIVGRQLTALSRRTEVRSILDHAAQLGFTPLKRPKSLQGFKRTYNPVRPIERGPEKLKKLEFSYQLQEFSKRGSKDKAAVIVTHWKGVGVAAANEIDSRLLVAPHGDLKRAREFKYNPKKMRPVSTRSWWTRFKDCLKRKCSSACLNALVTCPPTGWAAYLACLALKCGGCSAKCAGCASCRCRWWCKWAVGCCR